MTEAVRCSGWVKGPKMKGGGGAVAWQNQCQRTTKHESGRCPSHRNANRG